MALSNISIETDIERWIREAFKSENLKDINIKIEGTIEKGDGFVGDITFVVVEAINVTEKCVYHLAVKSGKKDEVLRESMPIREAFKREIFMYNDVIPNLKKLPEMKCLEPIDFIPKIYKSLLHEDEEVIILENLKALGYTLPNKTEPMNDDHLKLTLEAYAKWHALSFALRDQNKKLFDSLSLFDKQQNVLKTFWSTNTLRSCMRIAQNSLYHLLSNNRRDFFTELQDRIPNPFIDEFIRLMDVEEPLSVFLHADCWHNNMMFKYKNDDSEHENPEAVKLLDFQVSFLASPVYDLSYHIYIACSEIELANFKEYLKIYYYETFSNYLRQLGCDPEAIFPYSTLVEHWKKYSTYGFLYSVICIEHILNDSDEEKILDLKEIDEEDLTRRSESKSKAAVNRLLAMVEHFLFFDDFY